MNVITLHRAATLNASARAYRLHASPGHGLPPPQWREVWALHLDHPPLLADLAAAQDDLAHADPDDAARITQMRDTINRLHAALAYRPDPHELGPAALRLVADLWHAVPLHPPPDLPPWVAPALGEEARTHRAALLRGIAARPSRDLPTPWPAALISTSYPQALEDGAPLIGVITAHDGAETARALRDALRRVALPHVAEMVRGDNLGAELTAAYLNIPDDAAVMPSELHTRASLRAEVSSVLAMIEDL